MEFVAQAVHDDVDEHGIGAVIGMLQRIHEVRNGGNFRIGERGGNRLGVTRLAPFFFQRVLVRNCGPLDFTQWDMNP